MPPRLNRGGECRTHARGEHSVRAQCSYARVVMHLLLYVRYDVCSFTTFSVCHLSAPPPMAWYVVRVPRTKVNVVASSPTQCILVRTFSCVKLIGGKRDSVSY